MGLILSCYLNDFFSSLLEFLFEPVVLLLVDDELVKDVGDVLLGGGAGVLLDAQLLVQLPHLGLQVADDHLVLAADLGLVVSLAPVDVGLKVPDQLPGLSIQVLEVLLRRSCFGSDLPDARDYLVQVEAVGRLRLPILFAHE